MAYLIDETYFNLDINVPNTQEVNSGALIQLNQFIDTKARLLISRVLGYELFKDLNSYLVDGLLPDVPDLPDPDPVPAKWRNFVTGTEYQKNGKLVKWEGLIHTEGTVKQSLIAYFVFSEWLKNSVSQVNGVGEVTLVAKNTEGVNPTQRWVDVFNDFLDMYQGGSCTEPNIYFHYGVKITDWLGGNNSGEISLIEFLIDNKTDYPDANLFRYDVKNQLGL